MKKVWQIVSIIVLAGMIALGLWLDFEHAKTGVIVCTDEMKLCPGGSYVERVPPVCQFALCPGEDFPD